LCGVMGGVQIGVRSLLGPRAIVGRRDILRHSAARESYEGGSTSRGY
jgi:hypothetical protein